MQYPLLLILVKVTIFSMMLAIGINISFDQMLCSWRKPALLFRSLLAVIMLVPLVVFILLKLFNLPISVMMGLIFLAISPGAPLMTKRVQISGAKLHNSASLQLTLALLAVIIAPVTLNIFSAVFPNIPEKISILKVAQQITEVQFIPVILGLLLQKFAAKYAGLIAQPLNFIANTLFLILIFLVGILGLPLIFKVWGLPMVAILIMIIISLTIGHILGGPDEEQRSILAISSIARNVGLALFISVLNDVQKIVIPTLLAYSILGALLGIPYSIWCKRKLALRSKES